MSVIESYVYPFVRGGALWHRTSLTSTPWLAYSERALCGERPPDPPGYWTWTSVDHRITGRLEDSTLEFCIQCGRLVVEAET